MKFTTDIDNLNVILAVVGGAIVDKSSSPIMKGVKFSVNADRVVVETFNYGGERRQIAISAEDCRDGVGIVSHKQLSAIVAKLSGNSVTLEASSASKMLIRSGDYSGQIPGYDADDWVGEGYDDDADGVDIPFASAKILIDVGKAASSDESRPVLNHIMIRINKIALKAGTAEAYVLAATDGYRLSVYDHGTVSEDTVEVLVSKATTNGIARMASAMKATVFTMRIHKSLGRGSVEFRGADKILWGKITFSTSTDKFPNWNNIIPTDDIASRVVVCLPVALQRAVDRALTINESGDTGIIALTFNDAAIEVNRTTREGGASSEIVPLLVSQDTAFADPQGLTEITIGMNGKYLIDGLSIFDEPITVRVYTPTRPMKITWGKWRHVVMPMVLNR